MAAAFSASAVAARDLPDQFITRSTEIARKALIERVHPAARRIDLLTQLLRPAGRVVGVPGGGLIDPRADDSAKWSAWRKIGFPHDRAALDAYAVFAGNVELVESERIISILPEISVVTTGSPAANQVSQLYVPYRDENGGGKTISRTFAPECVPYHYEFLAQKRRRRVPGSSELAIAPHKGLSSKGTTFLADRSGDGSMLRKDFLLISRLPRGLSNGGDIINVGGGYGPGTEALKLLFDRREFPDEEVRALEKALGGARYFQVAFVCDIDDSGDTHNLRIWEDCPPVGIALKDLEISPEADTDQDSALLPTWSEPE